MEEPRHEVLSGRFTKSEKDEVLKLAVNGLSDFVREAVLEKLKREGKGTCSQGGNQID